MKNLCLQLKTVQELVCFPRGKCLQKSIVKDAADGILVDSMYLSSGPDFREGLFNKNLRLIISWEQCLSTSPKFMFVCVSITRQFEI